jgi:hypothetical protein
MNNHIEHASLARLAKLAAMPNADERLNCICRLINTLDPAHRLLLLARLAKSASPDELGKFVSECLRTKEHLWALVFGPLEFFYREARAQAKARRDRKSDPETLKRYAEICERRRQGELCKNLASTYDLTPRQIYTILRKGGVKRPRNKKVK